MDTTDRDPDRAHADQWCEQPYQKATPFLPYQPAVQFKAYRAAKAGGVLEDGQPDPENPPDLGQEEVAYQPMRPSVAAVREQPEVKDDHCLKHYLLKTFHK
jgi:hypothetical protein